MLQLLDHDTLGQHPEFLAPELLGNVYAPKADFARLGLQDLVQLRRNERVVAQAALGLPANDQRLLRDQLALRERAYRIADHAYGVR
ncbi:hypothetical protein D3C72_2147310 [compost metagenome]